MPSSFAIEINKCWIFSWNTAMNVLRIFCPQCVDTCPLKNPTDCCVWLNQWDSDLSHWMRKQTEIWCRAYGDFPPEERFKQDGCRRVEKWVRSTCSVQNNQLIHVNVIVLLKRGYMYCFTERLLVRVIVIGGSITCSSSWSSWSWFCSGLNTIKTRRLDQRVFQTLLIGPAS